MIHALHHIAWLYHHGLYDQAAHAARRALERWPHHAEAIHRALYRINPDWGL